MSDYEVEGFIEDQMRKGRSGTLKELIEQEKKSRMEINFENTKRILDDINEKQYGVRPYKTGKKDCPYCEGTGVRHVPNGPDDYDLEECDCVTNKENE